MICAPWPTRHWPVGAMIILVFPSYDHMIIPDAPRSARSGSVWLPISGGLKAIVRMDIWRAPSVAINTARDYETAYSEGIGDIHAASRGASPLHFHRPASILASRIRSESHVSYPFASFCMELMVG